MLGLETLVFNLLFCLAIVPLIAVVGRVKVGARTAIGAIVALWSGLAVLIVLTQFFWVDRSAEAEMAVTNRPVQVPADGYVGSATCQSCHPHHHATWHDSYHRTMTQVASEQSVIGDFNDVRLVGKDLEVRLFKEGQQFMVAMNVGNSETTGVFPVVMTTGSHNRQAYWLATSPDSRKLMILPYMYMRAEEKWIPRHSGYINAMCLQERPELAVLAADTGRWSVVCIKCHTTHGRSEPAVDKSSVAAHQALGTQAAEFGISCEACHGPAAEHVRANRNPIRRYEQHLTTGADSTIVNPARLPHDRASQVCGQCHSVHIPRSNEARDQSIREGNPYRPGDDLNKDPLQFIVRGREELMPDDKPKNWHDPYDDGSFWSDGMTRASGREYNGLIDSPCFQRGEMSCLSCHQMHQSRGESRTRKEWADDQLKLGMDKSRACVQCHDQFEEAEKITRHTHHAANSTGSNCYNCHMPFTSYGILKAQRSHQITSPSVQASLETGRPNACNQCHLDKTLAWTADRLSTWYAIPKPELSDDEQQIAATVLWTLHGDAGQRGLMAWTYGWEDALQTVGTDWQAPYLAQLLDDRYDAVRYIAHRSLKRLPGFADFEYDFVGPPEERTAAHQRALQVWGALPKSRAGRFSPEVLIDAEGHVMESEFQRLWKLRDDRPMAVNE